MNMNPFIPITRIAKSLPQKEQFHSLKMTKMPSFITEPRFTVAAAEELCGKIVWCPGVQIYSSAFKMSEPLRAFAGVVN